MKFILTGLGLFLFFQIVPPVSVFAKALTPAELNYLLEHSTFNPALRGETSERWDFEHSDEYKLEHSTFDPEFRGEDSEQWDLVEESDIKSNAYKLEHSTFDPNGEGSERWDFEHSDEYKLEHSTFDPEYGMEKVSPLSNHSTPLHIEIEDFDGRLRSTKPLVRSISLDSFSIRLYPIRTSYRQRILR